MSAPRSQLATAKAIQRRTGRTFNVATGLLPDRARAPAHVLYAFFRVADEIVDDPDPTSIADQKRDLETIRAQALDEREPTGDVMQAFADVRDEFDLDCTEIDVFLDAMAMDLEQKRYETSEDLSEYLRGSSVAVANLLLDVFATEVDPEARPHATALAEALQLTNFLRDVREDVRQYDRIYLPLETLRRHDVTVEEIESLSFSDTVALAIEEELERTEDLYREGVAGIHYLPEDVQFGVLLAAILYAEHHRLIRQQGYDTLSRRPSLSATRRLALSFRAWLHWQLSNDPQDIFEAVSALPNDDDSTPSQPRQEPVTGFSRVETDPQQSLEPAKRATGRLRGYLQAGSK